MRSVLMARLVPVNVSYSISSPADATDKSSVPATEIKDIPLAEAIATVTGETQVYTAAKLPPALPTPFKRWVPTLSPDAPHDPHTYFPMSLYR